MEIPCTCGRSCRIREWKPSYQLSTHFSQNGCDTETASPVAYSPGRGSPNVTSSLVHQRDALAQKCITVVVEFLFSPPWGIYVTEIRERRAESTLRFNFEPGCFRTYSAVNVMTRQSRGESHVSQSGARTSKDPNSVRELGWCKPGPD